jgi:hypothetical protein
MVRADERGNPIVETGAVFKTASGRETSPAPKIDASTDRRTKKTIFSLNSWLLDEAKQGSRRQRLPVDAAQGALTQRTCRSPIRTPSTRCCSEIRTDRARAIWCVSKARIPKAKSVDDLTEAEKKAHRDAPTWAQVLAELPMHKDGRTREHEIAFDIIKEITGKKKAVQRPDAGAEGRAEAREGVEGDLTIGHARE